MATFSNFEDIEAWKLARIVSKEVYTLSTNTELSKDYSLKDQMRRSVGSMMDNIAEGYGRNGKYEFVQFLSIGKASSAELQSQLYRSLDNNYITQEAFDKLYNSCKDYSRMLTGLINYLNKTEIKGYKYKERV